MMSVMVDVSSCAASVVTGPALGLQGRQPRAIDLDLDLASRGRRATCTVERAGLWLPKRRS